MASAPLQRENRFARRIGTRANGVFGLEFFRTARQLGAERPPKGGRARFEHAVNANRIEECFALFGRRAMPVGNQRLGFGQELFGTIIAFYDKLCAGLPVV